MHNVHSHGEETIREQRLSCESCLWTASRVSGGLVAQTTYITIALSLSDSNRRQMDHRSHCFCNCDDVVHSYDPGRGAHPQSAWNPRAYRCSAQSRALKEGHGDVQVGNNLVSEVIGWQSNS